MIFAPSTNKPYRQPAATSIYQLLKMQATKTPEALAVIAPARPPLTYDHLLKQVEHTVDALRAWGVHRNDRVGLVLPNGPEMAVACVAVAAGATCAPLNPSYRLSEFDFYLSDLKVKALLVGAEMHSPVREVAQQCDIPIIELTPIGAAEAGLFELSRTHQALATGRDVAQPEDTALVLHTSGTTSRPKIVPLTQTNICSSAHAISTSLELRASDRCLNVMPLFHIHGLIGAVLASLTVGASIVCTPGFDAERFFDWVDAWQPTWYTAVPTMHQAILARAPAHQPIIARCPLRFIRSCSAPLPERVLTALEEVFDTPVIEAYGMTEAAHQMTSNPLPPFPRKVGSVGVAAGADFAIMDAGGNLLPAGAIGEIVIRGPNVMSGYDNNLAANQSSFTNGWFHTGDLGRVDPDGYLFLMGRIKEIINRGGEKLAPREVDDVLLQHPAIAQATAFAIPHATLGEDVAAAVVLHDKATVTTSDIRAFAATRLADFKVPSQVVIVEEIPKGPTGKVQRIGLAEKLAVQLQTNFVAPGNALEQQLAAIWQDVLRIEHVGVRDHFYALGADSIAAAVMLTKIANCFNTEIPLASFLRSPTIETLARLLQEQASSMASGVAEQALPSKAIQDSVLSGLKNRLLQLVALYAPGYKTTRVWLHRMRGVSIGHNVSIGLGVLMETAYPRLICIGNNVTIGMRAIVIGHLRDLTTQARESHEPTVRIEDNVYIGPGVIVLPNVTIGHDAVVSAGSVVARSVPPQTLVQGNPAKPIAHCGVSLGGGVAYEQFLRHLKPLNGNRPA